jgi:simple sugar transport system permease protein
VTVALLISLVLGVWNGFLVAVLGNQPIIATLILMTAGRGVAMLITEGQIITVNSPPFKALGSGFWFGIPIAVIIAAVVFGAAALITRRTALGMFIESVGINPEASRQAGVRARGLLFAVYTFCAFCAAIAGLILTANTAAADANNTGLFIELDAILAVVIGGTSLAGGRYSLVGTLVGALVIQTLVTTVYTVGIPPIATMVFKAAVVTVVCLLQSPTTAEALSGFRRRLAVRAGKGAAAS